MLDQRQTCNSLSLRLRIRPYHRSLQLKVARSNQGLSSAESRSRTWTAWMLYLERARLSTGDRGRIGMPLVLTAAHIWPLPD